MPLMASTCSYHFRVALWRAKEAECTRMNSQKTVIAILATLSVSFALAEDFKTINGKEYKNVKVSRVEPDGVVITFSGGIVKIPFAELPPEIQAKYGYNPQAAVDYQKQAYEAGQRRAQELAEAQQRQAEERAKYWSEHSTPQPAPVEQQSTAASMHGGALDERPSGPSVVIYGWVNQVVNEGLLVTVRTRNDVIGGERIPNGATVLVVGQFPGVYDDDKIQVQGRLIGPREYTTVMGATRTVRAVGRASVTKLNSFPY